MTLYFWTVFRHPRDHPTKFVVRRFAWDKPTARFFVADTLEEVRACIPPGLYRRDRDPEDDPVIVETWF